MKTRFRLIRRGSRGGAFYCVDCHTGKRTSLQTSNEDEAIQIIQSKNQAEKQPALNLQIAKAYLAGTDSGITTRTWQNAIEALTATKQDANQARWKTAAKDHAIKPLLPQLIVETKAELILSVLRSGTVSTNVYLRRLHNFCVDMNWLPWPIVPKRQATAPFTGTTLYLRVALDFTGNSGTGVQLGLRLGYRNVPGRAIRAVLLQRATRQGIRGCGLVSIHAAGVYQQHRTHLAFQCDAAFGEQPRFH